jgi:hypothetical protein
MRVPSSADNPTYDETFKVGFWRWLTSSKADRVEWARRRNAATVAAGDARVERVRERGEQKMQAARDEYDQKQAELAERRAARKQGDSPHPND